MTQTLHIKIELDPPTLARAIKELNLSNPPEFILNHSGYSSNVRHHKGRTEVRGLYNAANNRVSIASQHASSSQERVIELVRHLSFTVLHELRHAFQREHWTDEQQADHGTSYRDDPHEIDANEWAEYARPIYMGLVKITRRPVGGKSAFQKLGQR